MDSISIVLKNLNKEKKFVELDYTIDNLNSLELNVINSISRLSDYIETLTPFSLKVLRTFSLDPYHKILKGVFATRKLDLNLDIKEYGQVETEIFNSKSNENYDAVLIWERLEDLLPLEYKDPSFLSNEAENKIIENISERINDIVTKTLSFKKSPIIYAGYYLNAPNPMGISDFKHSKSAKSIVEKLNIKIKSILASHPNCFYLDICQEISAVGKNDFFDSRMEGMFQAPFKPKGFIYISAQLANIAWALKGFTKKCLVLDCDNTLWGGVIGEDKLQGIKLGPDFPGSEYIKFQRFSKSLTKHGTIIALNSKNNENDAMEVFLNHPHTIIKESDIACKRINWNTKVQNLQEIASDLNIGLDSIVFVDDSDFECEMVKKAIPQAIVKKFPSSPEDINIFTQSFFHFEASGFSKEDSKRSEMYQAQAKRHELQKTFTNMEDFYRSLEIKLSFSIDNQTHIQRTSQLSNKTNQFNLTTKRYNESQIKSFMEDSYFNVFTLSAKDKFGDNGITGVAIIKRDGEISHIDTFLLSCRIIGRGIETALLAFISQKLKGESVYELKGKYLRTKKNDLVSDFYQDQGFDIDLNSSADDKNYSLNIGDKPIKFPSWINWEEI